MSTSPFLSQTSLDLDIYLPEGFGFDSEEALSVESPDGLLRVFNFGFPSTAHRVESLSFDPSNDLKASITLSDHDNLLADIDSLEQFDCCIYDWNQSTVVPHLPPIQNMDVSQKNQPLPALRNKVSKTKRSPRTLNKALSNNIDIKRFLVSDSTTGRQRRPFLHEFIRLMLESDEYLHIAEYIDRKKGIFKLHQPDAVAELWKQVKGRNSDNNMTYDKLARAIRYYYGNGIMQPNAGRFTFRFGPKSGFGTTWRPAFQ